MEYQDNEVALCGWDAILGQINHWIPDLSPSKMLKRYKQELLECGAVFRVRHHGPTGKYRIYAFPSILKAWLIKKGAKGCIL